MNQYLTAIVIAFLTGISSQLGNLVGGQVELWMLLPMAGFGIAGGGVFLLGRFLWKLHTTNRKLLQNYATLEGKIDALTDVVAVENKKRDDAVTRVRSELMALVAQVKGDLRKESSNRTEAIKDVKIQLEKTIEQRTKPKPAPSLADSIPPEVAAKIKPPAPVPTEILEATGLFGLGLANGLRKK